MKDSAGKFCPDKWTRQEEEGRVEGTGHEEVPHEEEKEDHDVTARSPARTHSRSDQPNRSREFSQGNPGHAAARCAGPDLFPKRGRAAEARFVTGVGHPHGMHNEF